ncbi:FtsL-like putative cell division protein [Adhaeribacter aquaticus]|uniref:FtsL-like putative cell division protein n=1 Tax=Adhaeribacter aquaticus TaxID=299567 RepID=UPI00040E2D09|nr:FtsL-like putative cell division protein [Adhaeribacter aquaticus]
MAFNTVKERPVKRKANTLREVPQVVEERPERPKGISIFHILDRLTRMDSLFHDGLPVKYLPYILYLMVVALFYIGNTHYAEKTIRKIDRIKSETDDLRADYTTLKSDYMEASKQSEVARNVASSGLIESSSPPYQIVVNGEEY